MSTGQRSVQLLHHLGGALRQYQARNVINPALFGALAQPCGLLGAMEPTSHHVKMGMGLHQRRCYSDLPPHTLMGMPALSPTMTQGNIAKWLKKEGDEVAPGHILAEVETDKATIEWEAQEEGFVAKLLKPDGSKDVEIGSPVYILVEEQSAVPAFKDYVADGPKPSQAAPASEAPKPPAEAPKPADAQAPKGRFPDHQVHNMPALSPTMSHGNIIEWNKKVGDSVAAGDVLCEVETDKATVAWESTEDAYVAQILLPAGSKDVPIGTPAVVTVEDQASLPAFKNFTAADATGGDGGAQEAPAAAPEPAAAAPAAAATTAPPPPPQAAPQPSAASGDRIVASPYARKLAADSGLNLATLAGSGPEGRIVAEDVERAIAAGKAAPAQVPPTQAAPAQAAPAAPAAARPSPPPPPPSPGVSYTDHPHSQIRRITAQRLLEAKVTVPHYYVSMEIQMDEMMRVREQINAVNKDAGVKVSVNDIVIKAAALALKQVPGVNASWQPEFIREFDTVDISVAVQTPKGLLTPIVRDADKKRMVAISHEVKALAKKAKDGKLQPTEFIGGTFTVSNLGMFGVKNFCAIINPPQAAILAIGGADKKLVLKDGQVKETSTITATLSCDHRVVDGAMGAEWLKAFKGYIEAPFTMM